MRNNIAFKKQQTAQRCEAGIICRPAPGRYPTIVMAHGFSAVKEMYLDKFAEAFMQAGFASIVYDNRNFGASDGEPGRRSTLGSQVRDYSDAITFARSLEQTDGARIAAFGGPATAVDTCWSWAAGIDRRSAVLVVSQVPLISGWQNFRRGSSARGLSCAAAGRIARRSGQPRVRRGRPQCYLLWPRIRWRQQHYPPFNSYKWFTENSLRPGHQHGATKLRYAQG